MALGEHDDPVALAARRAAHPGEPILALPFDLETYFAIGRPPMRGYVIYLPWDADYARHPWHGYTHDICVDMRRNPPPVVFDNNWVVWNRYDPRRYMACVTDILRDLYTPAPGVANFYVRKDRLADWIGPAAKS